MMLTMIVVVSVIAETYDVRVVSVGDVVVLSVLLCVAVSLFTHPSFF